MQKKRTNSHARIRLSCALPLFLLAAAVSVRGADRLLNRPAPDFSRSDLQHRPVRLSQYRGKVVLLDFWATWCAPCRVELPRFEQWQKQYGPAGLQVVGVSVDDEEAPVLAYAQKLSLNFPIVMGDARLAELYGGVYGVPLTFLIDRQGRVRARVEGEANLERMEVQIRSLLRTAEPRPSTAQTQTAEAPAHSRDASRPAE